MDQQPTATRFLLALLAISFIAYSNGFTSPSPSFISNSQYYVSQQHRSINKSPTTSHLPQKQYVHTALNAEKKDNNNSGLAPGVSKNLLAETIAPFRGLRLFFYGSFASGAFVGGLITASGVAAALSGVRTDVDLNTEYLNLAIDFGAVALFAVLAKFDLDKGEELRQEVDAKVEKRKKQKKLVKSMREREANLAKLELDVRVSEDGETRRASVGVMQEKAKQHIILVAGPGRVVRDALRGAQLNKVSNIMCLKNAECLSLRYYI